MIRRNKNAIKYGIKAKIVFEGQIKNAFKRGELEQFAKNIEKKIINHQKKAEASDVLLCLSTGAMVKVEKEKIDLYFDSEYWILYETITENPELIALLRQLMHP